MLIMQLLGILVGLGLLIWLAFRDWTIPPSVWFFFWSMIDRLAPAAL
jgi:hypothetical protein